MFYVLPSAQAAIQRAGIRSDNIWRRILRPFTRVSYDKTSWSALPRVPNKLIQVELARGNLIIAVCPSPKIFRGQLVLKQNSIRERMIALCTRNFAKCTTKVYFQRPFICESMDSVGLDAGTELPQSCLIVIYSPYSSPYVFCICLLRPPF